jgi:hypothetical protein
LRRCLVHVFSLEKETRFWTCQKKLYASIKLYLITMIFNHIARRPDTFVKKIVQWAAPTAQNDAHRISRQI